jgi:hypothetical protein
MAMSEAQRGDDPSPLVEAADEPVINEWRAIRAGFVLIIGGVPIRP